MKKNSTVAVVFGVVHAGRSDAESAAPVALVGEDFEHALFDRLTDSFRHFAQKPRPLRDRVEAARENEKMPTAAVAARAEYQPQLLVAAEHRECFERKIARPHPVAGVGIEVESCPLAFVFRVAWKKEDRRSVFCATTDGLPRPADVFHEVRLVRLHEARRAVFGAVSFAEEVERVALQHPRADRKKIVGSKNYVSASTVPEKVGMAERS